jgi:hypothetical protein
MNQPLSPGPTQPATLQRRLANLLVALVVLVVAAATFVFSYDGVRSIALLGGVSAQLARYYPGLFDAVLVIACVAAVVLRDGRWWARLWAWLVIIILLAAIGTTDVLHAMNYTLRHRTTEGIVAAAPVVAVLIAFSLLLTMLRQSRTHAAPPAAQTPLDVPALPAAISAPPMALPAAPPTAPATVPAEQQDAGPGLAATVPLPTTTPDAAPAPEDGPAPGAAPTRADPVTADAPAAPAAETLASEAAPARDEPAPPTVEVPALAPGTAPVRGPQGIRYAGNGVPGMAGKPQAIGPDASPDAEYWESAQAGQFAGLVYPAREDDADPDDAADEAPRLNRVRSTPIPPADEDE